MKLTEKEVNMISDLLTFESTVCKKARLYSKTITDGEIAAKMEQVANNHQKRFNSLLNIIS